MTEWRVYGERKSSGNKFSAPIEARNKKEAERKFLSDVGKPSDFHIEGVVSKSNKGKVMRYVRE